MAKITAPLFGFRASGTIAKTVTYSTWKGQPIAKMYSIPSNPNTPAQQTQRATFQTLAHIWNGNPIDYYARLCFNHRAFYLRFRGSGYNLFMSRYLPISDLLWVFVFTDNIGMTYDHGVGYSIFGSLKCSLPDCSLAVCCGDRVGTADSRREIIVDSLGNCSFSFAIGPDGDIPPGYSYGWFEFIDDSKYLFSGSQDIMLP